MNRMLSRRDGRRGRFSDHVSLLHRADHRFNLRATHSPRTQNDRAITAEIEHR